MVFSADDHEITGMKTLRTRRDEFVRHIQALDDFHQTVRAGTADGDRLSHRLILGVNNPHEFSDVIRLHQLLRDKDPFGLDLVG